MTRRVPAGASPFAESPEAPATSARLVWEAGDDGSTLVVEVLGQAAAGGPALDLAALPLAVTVVTGHDVEQVTLCDGFRRISLIVKGGSLLSGPVRARFVLDHAAGLDRRIVTLRRLAALLETGRFPRSLFPREPRAERWLLALRAFDAAAAGASQQEIAEVLFSSLRRGAHWHESDFLRLRVNRLLRLARRMASGDYRALLR